MKKPPDRTKDSLVRLPEVQRRTGLSRASIYRRMEEGSFPHSHPIGTNAVAWYESDVGDWVANPMGWGREAA